MLRPSWRLVCSLALLSPAGCSSSSDVGSIADSPVFCDSVRTEIADDESTSLGFTPADVMARFGGPRTATFEYYEGPTTELSLELKLVGKAALIQTSYPEGFVTEDDPDLECGSTLMELDLHLEFGTADGKFAEQLPVTWMLGELNESEQVNMYIPISDVAGSYDNPRAATDLSFVIGLREGEPDGAVIGVIDSETDLPSEFNIARFNNDTWPQTE